MHLLILDHRLARFCDRKRQHYLALLDALPPRLLRGCLREVTHQHVPLYLAFPVMYALQGHEVVAGTIRTSHLKRAVPSGVWDGDIKGAELAQEEENCRSQANELCAKFCAVLGRCKAEVKRGPARSWRVVRAPDWGDHAQLGCAIKVEGVWTRGDVNLIGDGEDGLEADTLLAYMRVTRGVKESMVVTHR
jgi:hypothetical protein